MQVGDTIIASRDNDIEIQIGNAMPLYKIPIGTKICQIELHPGKGSQLCRAAGTSGSVLDKQMRPGYVLIKMQSKEQRFIPEHSLATIGVNSNPLHHLQKLGKAGRKRHLGRRPKTRGVAMNPVDHPHGGGEGKEKVEYHNHLVVY